MTLKAYLGPKTDNQIIDVEVICWSTIPGMALCQDAHGRLMTIHRANLILPPTHTPCSEQPGPPIGEQPGATEAGNRGEANAS